MHVTEVDLNYTQFYPLANNISLYPKKERGTTQKEKTRDRGGQAEPKMWAEVEKCRRITLDSYEIEHRSLLHLPHLQEIGERPATETPTEVDTTGIEPRERKVCAMWARKQD